MKKILAVFTACVILMTCWEDAQSRLFRLRPQKAKL